MEENILIEKLKKQDRIAQKLIFEKYSGLFYAICLRYATSQDEAKDILQEAFMKIFLNINKYSGTGSFEGWMKKILINHSINYYHKAYKYRFHDDVSKANYIEDHDTNFENLDFTYDELLNIISQLPLGYKTIFNLFAIEGYKHKEIAEMLNISENTSKSQFHRAKAILQEKIEQLKILKNGK